MLLALEVVPHSFIFIIYQRGKRHANEDDPTNMTYLDFQQNQARVGYRKINKRIGIKVISGQPRAHYPQDPSQRCKLELILF